MNVNNDDSTPDGEPAELCVWPRVQIIDDAPRMLPEAMMNRGLILPLRLAQYYCFARLSPAQRAKLLIEMSRSLDRVLKRLAVMEVERP